MKKRNGFDVWTVLNQLIRLAKEARTNDVPPPAHRLLLIGPPSTGKSRFAEDVAKSMGMMFEDVTCYGQQPVDAIIGSKTLEGSAGAVVTGKQDGKAIRCMVAQEGGVLVINEINLRSADLEGVLYAILDDKAHITDADGNEVYANHGFMVIATTNATPAELPEAIVDRFDVVLRVTKPNPAIYDAEGLTDAERKFCDNSYDVVADKWAWSAHAYMRTFLAFKRLCRHFDPETAAFMCFGDMAPEVLSQLASLS